MIDINELRRLAQAAMVEIDGVSLNWLTPLQDFQKEATPAAISELLGRLEAAEKERDDLHAESDTHKALIDLLRAEIGGLRAKIEAMEKQEPVAWYYVTNGAWDCYSREIPPEDAYDAGSLKALYALPGAQAQSAPSVPVVRTIRLKPVINWLRSGCDPMKAADELELIAAAPEAKA